MNITVNVPATTANLGSGFDCIGAALTLGNQFQFSPLPDAANEDGASEIVRITVTGTEAERVNTDSGNLVYRAFATLYEHLGKTPPGIAIHIHLGVPLTRGLGSSATAIVGGLMGANQLAGLPLAQQEVMQLAISLEGHCDNVVPALLGGCQLTASTEGTASMDGDWTVCDVPWNTTISPIVAIPDFELSTAEARNVLPTHYSLADAIFNIGHMGLLLRGLETGHSEWLRSALHDRIHQPYRQALIPGYAAVRSATLEAGAYGLVISGAGPTLLALADRSQSAAVQQAMTTAWAEVGINAHVKALEIDFQGAIVTVT